MLFSPQRASGQDGGGSGAFLRLGLGTRALGLGGAYTAVADDGAAVYWNPAGVARIQRHWAEMMYRRMGLDRRQFVLAYTQGLEPGGGVGFAWVNVGVDGIDGRDLNGQPTGMLTDSENAVFFSFSPQFSRRISAGLSMKFLYNRLAGQTAKGFGGDIGVLVRPVEPLSLGLQFRDIGTRITWNTAGLFDQNVRRRETFPRSLTVGASYRAFQNRVLIATDVEKAQRRETAFRAGAEVGLPGGVIARTGLNDGQWAAGAGFITAVKSTRIRFNYVFLMDRIGLHETHAFEWEFGF
ncbi:MAG: PorV/PorQ family protein [Candidatus Latescibacteria bacterium]|nr:PorV/PorQ family protein [Candidatus Latescibacterota bacterium]